MTETTPNPSLTSSQQVRSPRRWQVLPIVELVVLTIGLLLPAVLERSRNGLSQRPSSSSHFNFVPTMVGPPKANHP
jgi:hypothetical protein